MVTATAGTSVHVQTMYFTPSCSTAFSYADRAMVVSAMPQS